MSECGTRPHINQDLCAAGEKILDPAGTPQMGRLRHQAINLVLQAGKVTGGGTAPRGQDAIASTQKPGTNAKQWPRRVCEQKCMTQIFK